MAKEINNRISPKKLLDNIGTHLANAYQAPAGIKFSPDRDRSLAEKAVPYHRIRESETLRTGIKTSENDSLYTALAEKITKGEDPLLEHIMKRDTAGRARLLEELTASDTESAWFEGLLETAEEKKRESKQWLIKKSRPEEEKKPDAPEEDGLTEAMTVEDAGLQLKADKAELEAKLLENLAGSGEETPRTFLAEPENLSALKRKLAIELYEAQLENEIADAKKLLRVETPEQEAEYLKNRPPYGFEADLAENYEEELEKLENSPQVQQQLQRLAHGKDIKTLTSEVLEAGHPGTLRTGENLPLFEKYFVTDAVKKYLQSSEERLQGFDIIDEIKKLSAMDVLKEFPDRPDAEQCQERINEYAAVIKHMEELARAYPDTQTEAEKELIKDLREEIKNLEDVTLRSEREKIDFNFRADMLIDYIDPSDPERRPMDAIEAREKLIRGAELEQISFADDEFVGTSQKVSFDKDSGKIIKGPEKLITRAVDLSQKTGSRPELQLEELRKIKEILSKSDPFYVKNSAGYNKTIDSLNKVIKAQEALDKDANIRQIDSLSELYEELDANVTGYIRSRDDTAKNTDGRAKIRQDAMKSLRSITGKKHVEKISGALFTEQSKLNKQKLQLKECKKIMAKWNKRELPTGGEELEQFKKDFETVSGKMKEFTAPGKDLKYLKMGLAEETGEYFDRAEQLKEKLNTPENKIIDEAKLEDIKTFKNECDSAMKQFYAMEPEIKAAKAPEKKQEAPDKAKQKEAPSKKKQPAVNI